MNSEYLGEPDLSLPNLRIWVRGIYSPQIAAYIGSEWALEITANCSAAGADVWCFNADFEVPDLANWLTALEKMYNFQEYEANLAGYGTELRVMLTMNRVGLIAMRVEITPSISTQSHTFDFHTGYFDQTYLPKLISSCRKVIAKYPLVGT